MKTALVSLMAAGLLASGGAWAQEDEDLSTTLEEKLDAAHERLEEAAHEVAELSAEIGKPVMEKFMAFGEGPRRSVIGVQLDPESGKDGARVKDVSPGGPAAQAGLKAEDVIIRVNGTDVKGDSSREVARIVRAVKPESKVDVRVVRNGKPMDFL